MFKFNLSHHITMLFLHFFNLHFKLLDFFLILSCILLNFFFLLSHILIIIFIILWNCYLFSLIFIFLFWFQWCYWLITYNTLFIKIWLKFFCILQIIIFLNFCLCCFLNFFSSLKFFILIIWSNKLFSFRIIRFIIIP